MLPLFADYRVFSKARPGAARNGAFLRALLDEPEAGAQFLAYDGATPVGFATLYYTRSSVSAAVLGTLNDLYVAPEARGGGVGRALMDHCARAVAARGLPRMIWYTHTTNRTAQRLYDTFEAGVDTWLQYSLPVGKG